MEDPRIVIAFPGQNILILCDINNATSWRVNGSVYILSGLFSGNLAGHNVSGRNILVEDIMINDARNSSMYICVLPQIPPKPDIKSHPTILYVAGECNDFGTYYL